MFYQRIGLDFLLSTNELIVFSAIDVLIFFSISTNIHFLRFQRVNDYFAMEEKQKSWYALEALEESI